MNAERYLPVAQKIAEAIPACLVEQGLNPLISRYVLSETQQGNAWLFVVMDDSVFEFSDAYAAPQVLAHLSSALYDHPVLFSASNGLRYAVLLNMTRNQR